MKIFVSFFIYLFISYIVATCSKAIDHALGEDVCEDDVYAMLGFLWIIWIPFVILWKILKITSKPIVAALVTIITVFNAMKGRNNENII